MHPTAFPAVCLFVAFAAAATAAEAPDAPSDSAGDRWRTPEASSEEFGREPVVMRRMGRDVRETVIPRDVRDAFGRLYGARVAAFARGRDAEELVVLALDDELFATPLRAQAALAQIDRPLGATRVAFARADSGIEGLYDNLRAAGFRALTLSDGIRWSHRVEFR